MADEVTTTEEVRVFTDVPVRLSPQLDDPVVIGDELGDVHQTPLRQVRHLFTGAVGEDNGFVTGKAISEYVQKTVQDIPLSVRNYFIQKYDFWEQGNWNAGSGEAEISLQRIRQRDAIPFTAPYLTMQNFQADTALVWACFYDSEDRFLNSTWEMNRSYDPVQTFEVPQGTASIRLAGQSLPSANIEAVHILPEWKFMISATDRAVEWMPTWEELDPHVRFVPLTADLNDYLTDRGRYYATGGNTIANHPVPGTAFGMVVLRSAAFQYTQFLWTTTGTLGIWFRHYLLSGWQPWVSIPTGNTATLFTSHVLADTNAKTTVPTQITGVVDSAGNILSGEGFTAQAHGSQITISHPFGELPYTVTVNVKPGPQDRLSAPLITQHTDSFTLELSGKQTFTGVWIFRAETF